jgi:hypothetical protein
VKRFWAKPKLVRILFNNGDTYSLSATYIDIAENTTVFAGPGTLCSFDSSLIRRIFVGRI